MAIGDGEDGGIAFAVGELDRLGLADAKRLLILRAASNFTMHPQECAPTKASSTI